MITDIAVLDAAFPFCMISVSVFHIGRFLSLIEITSSNLFFAVLL